MTNQNVDIFVAAQRPSYAWPKHWQRTIARIEAKIDINRNMYVYTVHVMNPEWIKACNQLDVNEVAHVNIQYSLRSMPERTAGTIDFDTVEDLDRWAAMVDRLDN